MKNVLPCFYPTTTIFIDDDTEFLELIIPALKLKNNSYKIFFDAHQGTSYIDEDTYAKKFSNRLRHDNNSDLNDLLGFRLEGIISETLNSSRYQQPSVLVIDYEMPGINGLEACKMIQNPFIKKIILTGVADEKMAVDAFNDGLIYQYIQKQDPLFVQQLQRAVQKAQQAYFQDLLRTPLQIMRNSSLSIPLFDASFIDYFQDILKNNTIDEYYLVYPTGSFLMISRDYQLYSLITLDHALFEEYPALLSDESLTAEKIEAIEKRDLMPCYYDPFNANPFWNEFSSCFSKPTLIQTKEEIFYSAFGQGFIPIDPKNIAFDNA